MLKHKTDVARLWRLGAFGNKLRSWGHPDEIPLDLRKQIGFSLRSIRPGGNFQHNLPYETMAQRWTPEFYICEPVPDQDRLVQGELMLTTKGWYFVYSYEPCTLREALTRQDRTVFQFTGWPYRYYLEGVMSPLSFIEVQDCFEQWPDAVIELTVFNRDVGDRPGRNTIIWEVRDGY